MGRLVTRAGRLALVTLLMCTAPLRAAAAADSVTLMWDPSPSTNVIGYVVHVGTTSGHYTAKYDVGNNTSFVFRDAVPGEEYYFAVGAYAAGPIYGTLSSEVSGFSNAPPSLENPGSQTGVVGTPGSLQLVGSDPYGDSLSYTATGLPAGLIITNSTGFIAGTPTAEGTYTVTATATDGVLSDTQTFAWTVTAVPNAAPSLQNPGNQTGMVGTPVSLQLVGSDPNHDPISYAATGLPAGLAITAGSGFIAGTPTAEGVYQVTATVTDGVLSNAQTFTWTVTAAPNAAPSLQNPGNQTGVVGTAVTLQLVGNDANGDPISYTATGLPAGLAITNGSGLIGGTPTAEGIYTVIATATDGALSDTQTFTWTVTAPVDPGDTTAPLLTVTSPTSDTRFESDSEFVTLAGTALDDTEVTEVTWETSRGQKGKATGTNFWIAGVPLSHGQNEVAIAARDKKGNVSTVTLTIMLKQPPGRNK